VCLIFIDIFRCYEQLVGAAYGITTAGDYGILNRSLTDYHNSVRLKLVPIMVAADRLPITDKNKTWETWVSGFYFNTAMQRIIWATDRLLTISAGLPLSFDSDLPTVKKENPHFFRDVVPTVRKRANHLQFRKEGRKLDGLVVFLDLIEVEFDAHKHPITEQNYIRAIRWDVNQRKHALGGFHRRSAGAEGTTWPTIGQDKQVYFAIKAFCVSINLYRSVSSLYFGGQHFAVEYDSA